MAEAKAPRTVDAAERAQLVRVAVYFGPPCLVLVNALAYFLREKGMISGGVMVLLAVLSSAAPPAVPRAVVCLLSALSFHRVGTQLPGEVWIALDRRARRPALRYPRLHVVRFGGSALSEGVETHRIEGVAVHL